MKRLIPATLLIFALFLYGCETVYEEPKDTQPHAKLKLQKSKATEIEPPSSETHDEIIVLQTFMAESGASCIKPAFLGFDKITGYKDDANVEAGKILSLFVTNGYAYKGKVRMGVMDSAYSKNYQCVMRARFKPEAGKTYIVSPRDGINKTCNIDVTDAETGMPAPGLEVASGNNAEDIIDCSE